MKKIIVEKNESVAEVIDRILNEPDSEITLVISKGSTLGKTMRNFHLLKREVEDAGRTLAIESVDENILAFAKESGMEGSHPLWSGSRADGGFSDILPMDGHDKDGELPVEKPDPPAKKLSSKKRQKGESSVRITIHEEEEASEESEQWEGQKEKEAVTMADEVEVEKKNFFSSESRFFKETAVPEARDGESAPRRSGIVKKIVGYAIFGVLVLAAAFFAVPRFLGSAKVTLDFQKTPWEYKHTFTADKSVGNINAANNNIPAQVFVSNKNITQLFPASGNANVSQKAKGTITIYNAYSSAPQSLVATTRFVTPDGKIFRLINGVTVPGAQVTNGQIVPSSINAPIIADQAGDSYNVGSIAKLAIPGFQGTPKYNGFYGSIASSTSGGFVGNKAVPTASDITAAKAKVTDILQSAFPNGEQANYDNFKILDGATSTQIIKLAVSTSTNEKGEFYVLGEAVFKAIGFDETALKVFLLTQTENNGTASSTFSALSMNYSGTQADFTKGMVSFLLDAQGTVEPAFSADDFRRIILGKSIANARSMIAALPGLADGTISAWPSWLANIPSNPNKVQIVAN
jgi:hypothetical protein